MTAEISKRAQRLWDRLRQWYGTRLAEQYGDEPPVDWRRLVDATDNKKIADALELIRRRHPTYPPTLPEFEAALHPPRQTQSGPSVQDRLTDWVVANRRLTPGQLARKWTWQHEGDAGTGRGFAITGVDIPASDDGGAAFHVGVEALDP